jgi:hypothetical protein
MRKILEAVECAEAANNSCSAADCESLADEEELPILKGVHT